MKIVPSPRLNLQNYPFHDALLGVSSGNDTPEHLQHLHAVILRVILNAPESTQDTIPVFKCSDINGKERVLDRDSDATPYDYYYGFHDVPQTVQVLWHPYGVVKMKKVKEILDEEVETHLFRPNIVRKTVQYSWQFCWDRSFAERIIYDAKQFALRVHTHLQEKLQSNAKSWSAHNDYIRVEIRSDYICFSSWGSHSSYITFKDEGLVNLSNAIQVLGCTYAVLECFDNSYEWDIRPYYSFESGKSGVRCTLEGQRKAAGLKQW